ncbi:hypothetical protein AURDEDRAFT_135991 [Auricularia subglabra TFB-10046 SS5]|nr:hypothetical protein AURDEDRAFT_135991 [Auricularia subglabra TFB-10046 SS5]
MPTRQRLSRQIEKWLSANARVLTWVLHQQWSALKTATEADSMILFCGSGFSKGSDGEQIPKMENPRVVTMSDAAVRRVLGEHERAMYPADGRAMAISVEGLTQIITVDMAVVTDALQKACAMLAAPCPNWIFVFEDLIAAQVQSLDECNMTLRAEVARRRAWELFVGENSVLAGNRMPALSALESDATWWRDSNWIDHPEFIEWYTKEVGRSPVGELGGRRIQKVDAEKKVHWDRLHEWIFVPHSCVYSGSTSGNGRLADGNCSSRRAALKRLPVTTAGWLARPAYIE